ncbi:hypothetical protein WN55_02438 [Dufourea novaeangliae]|uniref:Uncharacterized protein n=1 Tax=Dufourea novaeangliae TaxID=178035 RepID=A0A154PH02_DUFNO|nr:hypothetical protein WN55_02438 [Dufourea novaeangliae]
MFESRTAAPWSRQFRFDGDGIVVSVAPWTRKASKAFHSVSQQKVETVKPADGEVKGVCRQIAAEGGGTNFEVKGRRKISRKRRLQWGTDGHAEARTALE